MGNSGLGLNDPNQVMNKLDDPGGLHPGGGHRDVDGRGEGGPRGPADSRANGPRRPCPGRRRGPQFLGQYSERAKQQALAAAAKAQRGATIGSWVTFGSMVEGLGVSIAGAMGGVPSFRRWQRRVVEVRS